MNEQTQIPKRLRVIFLAGVDETGHGMTLERLVGHPFPYSAPLLYLVWLADLVVEAMLLAAAVSVWKMQRRGLLLLIVALVTEFIYGLSI